MKLIFGLGNPGGKYAATRHNIGFDTVTALADKYRIALREREHKGLCGKGHIGGERVILIQPQTFMNLSGECVREFLNFYKATAEDIVVIYDDIDLAPGKLRIRAKGSAGGHNGVKSIVAQLGTQVFDRVRVGVGAKPEEWDLADYVLSRFTKEEEPLIRDGIARAVEAVETILGQGAEAAMNRFN